MGRHAFVVRFEVNDLADGAVDENTLTHVLMESVWRVRKGARLWGEGKTNTDLYEHYLDHRGKKEVKIFVARQSDRDDYIPVLQPVIILQGQ